MQTTTVIIAHYNNITRTNITTTYSNATTNMCFRANTSRAIGTTTTTTTTTTISTIQTNSISFTITIIMTTAPTAANNITGMTSLKLPQLATPL